MDPTAYDRWWRNIIEKEEAEYVNHILQRGKGPVVKLTALGTPAVYQNLGRLPTANNNMRSSIVGSGMQVRKAQQETTDGSVAAGYPAPRRSVSCAGRSHGAARALDDDTRSVATSYAGSARGAMTPRSNGGYATPRSNGGYATPGTVCSYPRTPTFSTADSEVMQRLERLEKQLLEERLRREMAENDIRELMRSNGRLATPPSRQGGAARR